MIIFCLLANSVVAVFRYYTYSPLLHKVDACVATRMTDPNPIDKRSRHHIGMVYINPQVGDGDAGTTG